MRILIFIAFFLLVGAFFIISENNLSLKSIDNVEEFLDLYISWIKQIFNISKETTGSVIRLEWLPE